MITNYYFCTHTHENWQHLAVIPKKHLYFIIEFELNISWFPFFHFKKIVCDFKHVEICLDHERGMIVKECKKGLRGRRTHALTSYLFFSFRLTSGGTIYNQPQRKKIFFPSFFRSGTRVNLISLLMRFSNVVLGKCVTNFIWEGCNFKSAWLNKYESSSILDSGIQVEEVTITWTGTFSTSTYVKTCSNPP